ncbi:MAG: isochorismate synthase [Pseudomonadota bacterium]|nr:isochorismate synthase [Pseudomonadota bacterium]
MLDVNDLVRNCIKQATSLDNDGFKHAFVSITLPVQATFRLLPPAQQDHAYWCRPGKEYAALGLGKLFYQTAQGSQRFKLLQELYLQYCRQWQVAPTAYTAFAFDAEDTMSDEWAEFPNAILCVPRLLLEEDHGNKSITFNLELNADLPSQIDDIRQLLETCFEGAQAVKKTDAPVSYTADDADNKNDWMLLAGKGIDAIRQQEFKKLVVSRRHVIQAEYPDASLLLSALAERYPACTIISYQDNGTQLIAASPERLLSLNAGYLLSDAIGGTLTDNEIKQGTDLSSYHSAHAAKLMEEHTIIVEDICQRLEPVCQTLTLPTAPQLKKLHNIYHLETSISGTLGTHQTVLSLVEKLHPTPAIAGFPGTKSVNWLRDNEKHNRGWYAGAFGCMSGDQSGEVTVLLRCALINKTQINVYAGAGLVAESDTEMEWQETELKMNAILDLL